MFYAKYQGRSIGRLIYHLEVYGGVTLATEVVFSDNKLIKYHGERFATYEWLGHTDIAHFQFLGHQAEWLAKRQLRLQRYLDRPEWIYSIDWIVQEAAKLHNPTVTDISKIAQNNRLTLEEIRKELYFIRALAGKDFYGYTD